MAILKYMLYILSVLLLVVGSAATSCPVVTIPRDYVTSLNRSTFPKGFIFRTASSAYQEDVRIMKNMGMDAYRFSISWSRLLPNGKLSGEVNKEGIEYYYNLINELLANGINPFVTLFHWDLPQALEDEFGGFLSPNILKHYRDFAELCFKEFGDRVKNWITFNEPLAYSMFGYDIGFFPPARCSEWKRLSCTGGNSATEPYLVSHNRLLAHAATVKLYKDKYQAPQKGLIGITLVSIWFVPYSNTKQNKNAASRALDYTFGWFMDPLIHTMRSLVGERLPKFTEEQSKIVKGSFDFIGLNYYTSSYAAFEPIHLVNWCVMVYPVAQRGIFEALY